MSESRARATPSAGVAQLLLMHPKAQVLLPGDDPPIGLRGTPARVLRLLALSKGHSFSTDWLAEACNYTSSKSVAPMIMDLRRKLGGHRWGDSAITSDHGVGYRLDPETVEVDAFEFGRLALPLIQRYRHVSDPDDIPLDEADGSLAIVERAVSLWRVNPAIGLENLTANEHQYNTEYDVLYDRVQRLKILMALRVGTQERLRESILILERKVAEDQSPDWEHWCLLLRAYHSTGNPAKVNEVYARARRYYDIEYNQPVPRQISEYFQRSEQYESSFNLSRERDKSITTKFPDTSPALAVSSRDPELDKDVQDLINIVNTIGITTHSRLRLKGSDLEPVHVVRRVKHRLWFSGVLASKWVTDPAVRSEFADMLSVLDHTPNGDARFMILNPDGPGYRRLYELRNGHLSAEHIPHLARLVERHSSFQVKLFDHLPAFRILAVDKDIVTFSHYRLDEVSYLQADRGWDSPHIVLDPLAPWSLADAFITLYNAMWESSTFLNTEDYL